jgi:hypothetical protein
MSLNFSQVHHQIEVLGQFSVAKEQQLQVLRQRADELLIQHADHFELLQDRVKHIARQYDPSLRCASPHKELLNTHLPASSPPPKATLLAADGSQIIPDRHIQVNYGLINIGAITLQSDLPAQPTIRIYSQLFYGEEAEKLSEASLALQRDLGERRMLAELAQEYSPPLITLVDGPIELWTTRQVNSLETIPFKQQIEEYLHILEKLQSLHAVTAGYIDKPSANLVIRLLEVALSSEADWQDFRNYHPLQGVHDRNIFGRLLQPGERSAIFALQSLSARNYPGDYGLHFFYLNVSANQDPSLARVEIPAWVANREDLVNDLQAILVQQCCLLGNHPYPYLLHRAHETAMVSMQEKEQVTQMITNELRRQGVSVGKISQKQYSKNLPGRKRL